MWSLPRPQEVTVKALRPTAGLADVRRGLVLEVDVANATATRVWDQSGYGHTGLVSGSVTLGNPPENRLGGAPRALVYSADTTGKIDCLSPATLDDRPQLTYELLAAPRNAGGSNGGRLFDKTGNRFQLVAPATIRLVIGYSTQLIRDVVVPVLDLRYYHLVSTWDGTPSAVDAKQYVNGVEPAYVTTTSGAGVRTSDSAGSLGLGCRPDLAAVNFDGYLALARCYQVSLTAEEARQRYDYMLAQVGAI